MDQRDFVTLSLAGGRTGRCPVQPSTPLGPDQVNVLLFLMDVAGGYAGNMGGGWRDGIAMEKDGIPRSDGDGHVRNHAPGRVPWGVLIAHGFRVPGMSAVVLSSQRG
jgi:hypothetical protein